MPKCSLYRRVLSVLLPVLILAALLAGCSRRETAYGAPMNLSSQEAAGTERLESAAGSEAEESSEDTDPVSESESSALLKVFVCGQVKKPGVYSLRAGDRLEDAVKAAGGFTKRADPDHLNLAEFASDGQKVQILSREESALLAGAAEGGESDKAAGAESAEGADEQGLININTAAREELMTLTGIGASKADAILSYRKTNGPFGQIEDIMLVPGIKQGAFAKIKDSIKV